MMNQDIIINLGELLPVCTWIALVVPSGTYARFATRSGLAVKHGIDIWAGVINEDY
jgi:dUTP pyrophosphatase